MESKGEEEPIIGDKRKRSSNENEEKCDEENKIEEFMKAIQSKNPNEPEFCQAVREVATNLIPFIEGNKEIGQKYKKAKILERMCEPERIIIFRVPWLDDQGVIQINRGYRVQMNSAIGPYKGGLRFHPSVNLSVLKFLAFEQVFKNSLTTLALGGGKGGCDFDPKGKSDNEIMKFCQSFMTELQRHIGAQTDIPAGDIGVGGREIGFLFGQYKRLQNNFTGVLTGKGVEYGGSLIRPEATGYGTVYIAKYALDQHKIPFENKKCVISGSGNVAQYCGEKILELGGKIMSMSDSSGSIYDAQGITYEKLHYIMELKNVKRGRISEYVEKYPNAIFMRGKTPWSIKECDLAFPCATQNELNENDAKALVSNGCIGIFEGANMPTTPEAIKYLQSNTTQVIYIPGKASNAGGVATSGLEMCQNSQRLAWTRKQVDEKLQEIMKNIHDQCVKHGGLGENQTIDYMKGANLAGFIKVADAMLAEGCV